MLLEQGVIVLGQFGGDGGHRRKLGSLFVFVFLGRHLGAWGVLQVFKLFPSGDQFVHGGPELVGLLWQVGVGEGGFKGVVLQSQLLVSLGLLLSFGLEGG